MGYLKEFPILINNEASACSKVKCNFGEYSCNYYEICISVELICDGIKHCPFNDDEEHCG